jgi:heme/copper-type cytochrome/quinol oxidase subunit 2
MYYGRIIVLLVIAIIVLGGIGALIYFYLKSRPPLPEDPQALQIHYLRQINLKFTVISVLVGIAFVILLVGCVLVILSAGPILAVIRLLSSLAR